MVKLSDAHKEQIRNMQSDGKSDRDIISFFKSVYRKKLTSAEISKQSILGIEEVKSAAEINNYAVVKPYGRKYNGKLENIPISLTPRVFWRINIFYTKAENKKIISFLTKEKGITKKEQESALNEITEYISRAISWLGSADITPIKRNRKSSNNSKVEEAKKIEEILQRLNRIPETERIKINKRIAPSTVEIEIVRNRLILQRLKASKCGKRDLSLEELVSNLVAVWIKYTKKIPGRINRRKDGKVRSIPSPCFEFIEYTIACALTHANRNRLNKLRFKAQLTNTFRNAISRYVYLSSFSLE
jgi:hypothetical protein